MNIAGPIVALPLLSQLAGSVAIAGFLVIAFVVVRFDKVLMRLVRAQNDAERGYSAGLVESLGTGRPAKRKRLSPLSRSIS